MSPLVWIALLVVVGLMLILLEVFVPSGGVLGMLSVVALGAGIVTAFMEKGAGVGMTVLAGTFIAVPAVLAVGFRWFPATPLGRRVLPQPPAEEDVLPDPTQRRRLRDLYRRPQIVAMPLSFFPPDGMRGPGLALAEPDEVVADRALESVKPLMSVILFFPIPPGKLIGAPRVGFPVDDERFVRINTFKRSQQRVHLSRIRIVRHRAEQIKLRPVTAELGGPCRVLRLRSHRGSGEFVLLLLLHPGEPPCLHADHLVFFIHG